MASSKPTDEILSALPEVGLWLVSLGHAQLWNAMLADNKEKPRTYQGQGETPAAALIAALKEAGVDVSDD